MEGSLPTIIFQGRAVKLQGCTYWIPPFLVETTHPTTTINSVTHPLQHLSLFGTLQGSEVLHQLLEGAKKLWLEVWR